MKNSIYLSLLFCFSLAGLLTLSSCSDNPCADEEPSKNEYFSISETNKSKIPYRTDGLDTLIYISESGDSAVLLGQGKANYYRKGYNKQNSNPDCPFYDYNYLEYIDYIFNQSTSTPLKMVNFRLYMRTSEEKATFNINTFRNPTTDQGDYGIIDLSIQQNYTASVKINGNSYSGVPFYSSYIKDTMVIYSSTFGILQLKLENKVWKLKI